jgi:hypothetical protein
MVFKMLLLWTIDFGKVCTFTSHINIGTQIHINSALCGDEYYANQAV